jgi:4-hydroxyacetophenone monooxygenase
MQDAELDRILADAHLPTLVLSLVHMTGDPALLKPEWTPAYNAFPRGEPIIAEQAKTEILAEAHKVLKAHLEGRLARPAPLSEETVRRMMDFIVGEPIPENYAEFLADELAIDGHSTKDPQWTDPALKAAAAKLPVLVVGAGMSGLLAGIRLGEAGVPYTIIDKNADVGGTWLENTYPGCRVDSSNHMYSYSFEPNPQWPNHFSPQPVLLDYFQRVAERHDLRSHIRFSTTVEEMIWDEARQVWTVQLTLPDGSRETVEARAVITAVGQLNRPRFPAIEGRETFKGISFHSAEWRHDVDLAGKTVAVIGTGASAYQFVPEIAPQVASLTIFQRTPPWGFPVPNYHEAVPEGMKWLLEHAPYYAKWYRFLLMFMATDGLLPAVKADPTWNGPATAVSAMNQQFRDLVAGAIAAQAGDDADLLNKLVPQYPLGGKRALLDNGVWIEALKRDNVELTTSPITRIDETGLVTEDGRHHDAEVLIYGTGFHASRFLMPMKIKGRGGKDLHETWAGDPRAYLGMTTPGFPNLFMIYGPNTNIVVNGSIIFFSECSVRYIIGCLKLLAETGSGSLEVKKDVHEAFNIRIDEGNKQMAWGSPNVTSWYKNDAGRVTQNWPFALVDYWNETLAPKPEDFILQPAREMADA